LRSLFPDLCWICLCFSFLGHKITLAALIKKVQRQQRDADTMSKQPVDTVQLDVGGHLFKVSRSLLEQHPDTMLARLVSDDWQNDDNKDGTHFIDRNGERFQYVLDYMRDQKVYLPLTVSKEAFLLDLQYFGFDVDDSPVHKHDSKQGKQPALMIQQGSLTEFSQLLVAVECNMDEDLKKLDGSINEYKNAIEQCERKKATIKTAHVLFKQSSITDWELHEGNNERTYIHLEHGDYGTSARELYDNGFLAVKLKGFLKERLQAYGITLIAASSRDCYNCTFVLERKQK